MSITSGCIIGLILCVLGAAADQGQTANTTVEAAPSRFGTVDLFVDSAKQQLAAWEMEFKATTGQVEIVGIERGDNPDFQDPPYYDPAALKGNRIIVGAFDLAPQLSSGKIRVARLHLHISGGQKANYSLHLGGGGGREGKTVTS